MKKKAIILLCSLLLVSAFALGACSASECTVTLDANGGTVAVESVSAVRGEKLGALPAATRSGWFFGGWYTQKDGGKAWNFYKDTVDGDMTLYANWQTQGIVLSYNLNLPDSVKEHSETPQSVLLASGAFALKPNAPTAKGYLFVCWTDSEGTEWNFENALSVNTELKAKWVESVTLSFMDGESIAAPDVITAKGGTLNKLPSLSRTGFVFGGWMTDEKGETEFDSTAVIDKDTVLYAKWYEQSDLKYFSLDAKDEWNITLQIDTAFSGETLVLPRTVDGKMYSNISLNSSDGSQFDLPSVKTLVIPNVSDNFSVWNLKSNFSNLERIIVDKNCSRYFDYKGSLYSNNEEYDYDQNPPVKVRRVRIEIALAGSNGYTELYPETDSINNDGTFFIKGYRQSLIKNLWLYSERKLIVEDEYYNAYFNEMNSYGGNTEFLIKFSEYKNSPEEVRNA